LREAPRQAAIRPLEYRRLACVPIPALRATSVAQPLRRHGLTTWFARHQLHDEDQQPLLGVDTL
jgi:hypothetical protein